MELSGFHYLSPDSVNPVMLLNDVQKMMYEGMKIASMRGIFHILVMPCEGDRCPSWAHTGDL